MLEEEMNELREASSVKIPSLVVGIDRMKPSRFSSMNSGRTEERSEMQKQPTTILQK